MELTLRHKLTDVLAIEGYRSHALSRSQVRRLLGFKTSLEVDSFMAKAKVPFPYSAADLENDIETHRRVDTLGRQGSSSPIRRRSTAWC